MARENVLNLCKNIGYDPSSEPWGVITYVFQEKKYPQSLLLLPAASTVFLPVNSQMQRSMWL